MKKRLLSLICATSVVTSLLVGCSSDEGKGSNGEEVTLKVLTNRTDLKDTVLKEISDDYYAETGVKVKWEGITEYESVVQTRMNTQDYGDVLNILPAITTEEFSQFFEPYGKLEDYSDYTGIYAKVNDGDVYGLPIGVGASGIVYNKDVFAAAGYDTFPDTLTGLYEALGKINETQPEVVPVAINSADKWPLSQYDTTAIVAYRTPYYYRDIATMENIFSAGAPTGDMLEILYKFVSEGWVEEDLTTTNWEQSKVDIATDKVGMMTLGMWAVSQMQAAVETAGGDPDKIGFAPFPTNDSNELKAEGSPDNFLGVSVHSKHKEEAKAFAKYYADNLKYLDSQGFIPGNTKISSNNVVVKGYQESGVEIMFSDPSEADPKAEDLGKEIAAETGVKFWEGSYILDAVIAAKEGRSQFEDVINNFNKKWNKAKDELTK